MASFARLGMRISSFDKAHIGGRMSVLSETVGGSCLYTRSYARLGSGMSVKEQVSAGSAFSVAGGAVADGALSVGAVSNVQEQSLLPATSSHVPVSAFLRALLARFVAEAKCEKGAEMACRHLNTLGNLGIPGQVCMN